MANKFLNDTGLSTLWSKVDDKFVRKDAFNTALSGKSDVGHTHSYLPLSGGTIDGGFGALSIKRNNTYASAIRFENTSGVLGYIGFNDDYNARVWDKNGNDIGILIHSGNIGDQSVSHATTTNRFKVLLESTSGDLNTALAAGGIARNYNGGLSQYTNAPEGASYGIVLELRGSTASSLAGQLAWDVNHGSTSDVTRNLWWRASDSPNGFTYGKWHQIAFTDSNIASATKLATARTIWGQSFDGTGDVDGNIYLGSNIIYGGSNYNIIDIRDGGGLNIGYGIRSVGSTVYWAKSHAFYVGDSHALTINSSGNVGIGTTNPAYKLDVNGSPRFGNGSSCDVWLNRTSGNSYINAVDTLALTAGNDSGNIALVIGTDRSTVFTGNIYSNTKDAYLMFNRNNEGIYMYGGGINWHTSDNFWASSLIGFEQNSIKLQKFTNISGQLFTQYSTNNATIVPESSSLIIGHSPNKSGHTGYHTGIGFNALSYGSYLNHNHAWIGLGKYTTTATAECYPLVFATNESTTTNTSPIERMSIAPNGDVTIKKNLTVDGTITGNITGNVTGNCSGSAGSVKWSGVNTCIEAENEFNFVPSGYAQGYVWLNYAPKDSRTGLSTTLDEYRMSNGAAVGGYAAVRASKYMLGSGNNAICTGVIDSNYQELTHKTDNGYISLGPFNSDYAHIYTDRDTFYFNKDILINGTYVSKAGHTHTASEVGAAASNHTHNYFAENTPLYLREPANTSRRGGIYWGSAGNECLSFVAVNASTTFKFVCGSDIANWTNNTWQSTTGTLNISNTGITINGTTSSSGGFYESSDERIKDFEEDIQVDLQKLKNLKKKYFKFKGSDKLNLGVSAQEIQSIYPELVTENEEGYLSVDYAKLSVIALKAIDTMYDNFENRISQLEQFIKSK